MNKHNIRLGAALAACSAAALLPAVASAGGGGKTQTLRFFDKTQSLILTRTDGTVVDHPPYPEAAPGDRLDLFSLDFVGNHERHAARYSGSAHLQCIFGTGEPDCTSHVAIGNSMLIFKGNPGTVVGGTGRFLGASGRVVSFKEVGNDAGADVVAKVRLR
jgi:hypothetical protein